MSVKNQSPISIKSGSDCSMSQNGVSKKNQALVNVMKSLLLIGLCCFALSARGFYSSLKSKESSPDLLDKISKLTRDLDEFDRVKKQFTNVEIELQWDQQHITDLEERMKEERLRDYEVLGTLADAVREATTQLEHERNLNIAMEKTLNQMAKELQDQRNLRGVSNTQ